MVKRERRAATLGRLPTAANEGRATSHRPPSSADVPYPWLVFWHGKGMKRQTFYTLNKNSLEENHHHRRTIPELSGKTVLACSSDGWLVLSDDKNQQHFSLWNPSTLDSIALPPVKSSQHYKFVAGSCVFLSKPTSGTCTIVLFDKKHPLILYLRLGLDQEAAWSEIHLGKKELKRRGIVEKIDCFDHTVCCNGVIYAAARYSRGNLFTIVIDEEKFVLRSLKMELPGHEYYSHSASTTLAEYGGEVFTIRRFVGGIEWNEVISVEVYRLNLAAKAWEKKIDNVKGHVLFLGPSYSVSCATASALESSLIYFTKDRKVYCYNIEERSLSVALCFPQLPVPWSGPDWILPSDNRHVVENQRNKDEDEIHNVHTRQEKIIMGTNKGKEDQEGMNLVPNIPSELLGKIAGDLILFDYLNFRAVCTEFLLAAPAIQSRKASPPITQHSLSPLLVFSGNDRRVLNLIDPERGGKYFIKMPPELEDATIHYSNNGWLLMSRNQQSFFFFNPFTKVLLPWPDLDPQHEVVSGFLFTSVPTSLDCLVIGIPAFGVYLSSSSSQEWEYTELINGGTFLPHIHVPVLWNGATYFMCQKGKLGVLTSGEEEEEDGYTWKVLDKLQIPCSSFSQSFLVKCNDDLLSVFIGDFGTWLRVFRLDLSDIVWKEVNSIGNKAVFLSRSSAFSVVAKSKEMENRIYIPRLHQGSIVFYSLETRKYHSSRGDSFTNYADTVEQLLCGWIEPRWFPDTGFTSPAL